MKMNNRIEIVALDGGTGNGASGGNSGKSMQELLEEGMKKRGYTYSEGTFIKSENAGKSMQELLEEGMRKRGYTAENGTFKRTPYVSYADYGKGLLDRVNETDKKARQLDDLLKLAPAAITRQDQTLRSVDAEADSVFKSGAWRNNPLVSDMLTKLYDRRNYTAQRLETMKKAYTSLTADAQRAATENREAVDAYNGFYGFNGQGDASDGFRVGSGTAWDTWRGSIRQTETIAPELEAAQKKVRALTEQTSREREEIEAHAQEAAYMNGGVEPEEITARRRALQEKERELETATRARDLLQEEMDYSDYLKWEELRGNQDFAARSGYTSKRTGEEPQYDILENGRVVYTNRGSEDYLYDAINGDEQARNILLMEQNNGGEDQSYLLKMTPEQVSLYDYVYTTQGKEKAEEYLEKIKPELTAKEREDSEKAWREYAKKNPVEASAFSALTTPLKGVSYIGQTVDYLADGKIDENARYNRFSYASSAIRDQVSKTIEKSGKWGKVGSFLYQTGMSMADFLLTTAVAGGQEALALGIMGTGAAADSVIEAKERGLSDGKAFTLGSIAGLAEIVTEKVSLENLLDKTAMGKNALGYFLKNVVAEGSEEAASDVINWTADVLIAKDKSEWEQAIKAYMDQGLNEKAAFQAALKDKGMEILLDAAGGALSGGVMAGAGVAGNAAVDYATGRSLERGTGRAEAAQMAIEAGLERGRGSDSYERAIKYRTELLSGKEAGAGKTGRLARTTLYETAQEQARQEAAREKEEKDKEAREKAQAEVREQMKRWQVGQEAEEATQSTQEKNGVQTPAGTKEKRLEGTRSAREATAEEPTLAERRIMLERREAALREKTTQYMEAAQRGEDTGDTANAPSREADAIEKERRAIEAEEREQDTRTQNEALRARERELTVAPTGKELEERRERAGNLRDLETSGRESGATEEQIATARRIADATGRKIVFINEGSTKRGYYTNGTIYVNAKYGDETRQIIAHEMTHSIEESGDYAEFSRLAQNRIMASGRDLDAMLREVNERYEKNGVTLDPKKGQDMKEVVAEFVERELLTNEEAITSLVRENRSLGRRILDLLDKLLAKLGVKSAKERDFVRKARDIYAAALVDTRAEVDKDAALEEARRALAAGEITDEEFEGIFDALGIEALAEEAGVKNSKFSITAPVERTDSLIAVHNMDEEKLRRTLELGAWPSPSIAVVEAEQGHDMYGDYSAVFPRNTVNPEADKRNKVYGSDAWTPTHDNARVEYEVNYERLREIETRIRELSQNVAGGIFTSGSILRSVGIENETTDDLGAVARKLSSKDAVKAAYLVDKGETLEPEYKEKEYDRAGNDLLKYVINTLGEQKLAEAVVRLETTGRLDNGTVEVLRSLYQGVQMKRLTESGGKTKTPEAIRERAEMLANRIAENRLEDFVRHAWQMYQEGGEAAEEIDRIATRDKLIEAAPDKNVEVWVKGQIEGLLGEPGIYNGEDIYDSRGNRKSFSRLHWPVSAENIVRAMNNSEERGANMMGYGGGEGLLATATPEYKRVEEMHSDEGRLGKIPEKEYQQRIETLNRELEDVIQDIMRSTVHHSENTYEEKSIISYTISQAAGTDRSRNAIRRAFATEGYTITPAQAQAVAELLEHVAKMPTGYFEAKPQRVVGFNEAVAIAAPDNAPEDLLTQMRDAGLNVVTYKAGDRQSRIDVINSLEGAKFSVAQEDTSTKEGVQEQEKQEADIRDTIPAKARGFLDTVERRLVNKAGDILQVPTKARREYLRDIAAEISREYLKNGNVSDETVNKLFETAYDKGVEVDREFYDQYKELKKRLREMRVTIGLEDRAGVRGYDKFNDFRKAAMGILTIVNENGTPVDVAYQELSSEYPELFPEDITNPADMISQMYEVGDSIRISEKQLDEALGSGAKEFRKLARYEFEGAVNDTLAEMRLAKRYADERAEKASANTQTLTPEEVKELYPKARDARKYYEKVRAKQLLTEEDQRQVGRLMRGDMELSDLKPERDNVRGITLVFEAKQEYEKYARPIREWNIARKGELRQAADELLRTANGWKDKAKGILYSRETMERNIRDIVPDQKLAERIIDEYFKPVHEAAAKATKLKNQMRGRVKVLNLSRKVASGNIVSEAHAVQLMGEALDNIDYLTRAKTVRQRDGKSLADWRGVLQELYEKNTNMNWGKIKGAVDEFRKIYDELFEMMNESRVRNGYEPVAYRRGYFPHFQLGDGDGIISLFGKALGISTEVTALPTTINGLTHTFKPGIRWFGNALERTGFNTVYDAVEGFDKYIEGVADVIYQTENIQKLRALASQIRYRTSDEGLRKQIDEIRADTTLVERDKENRIKEIEENGRYSLSNFIVELDEYTNLLANKKSRADRNMEQALGRNTYNLVKALESRVAANMVAVNPASWLTNLIPLTQGWAMLDRFSLLRGMYETLKSYKNDDGIVDMSDFLTNRRGSEPMVRTWQQEASAKLSAPMEWIDNFTAGSLVRARYRQNINRGMSEAAAMEEADSWVAGVMADRSKGATPTLFNRSSPLWKMFTQFQLEVNNQLGYVFKDIPRGMKEKGIGALAASLFKFALGAWLYNEVYEYLIGRRPALDPIGILNDTVGDLTGYELPNMVSLVDGLTKGDAPSFKTNKGGAVSGLINNVADQLPFMGAVSALGLDDALGLDIDAGRLPVTSAIPDLSNLGKAVTGSSGWAAKKRAQAAIKEVEKPLLYVLLPFGGGQLKKILQGVDAAIKGGSFTVDEEGKNIMQYPVYKDTLWDKTKAYAGGAIFGKASSSNAVKWVSNNFKNYTARATGTYQGLTQAGVRGRDADELIIALAGAEKTEEKSETQVKLETLKKSSLPDSLKIIPYYAMIASDKKVEVIDKLAESAKPEHLFGMLMDYEDASSIKGDGKTAAQIKAVCESKLSDKEKIAAMEILEGSGAYHSFKMKTASNYGISMGDYYAGMYGAVDSNGDGSIKKDEIVAAIKKLDLTREQKAVLYQLVNTGWEPKNNPFSTKTGKEVYKAIQEEKDRRKAEKEKEEQGEDSEEEEPEKKGGPRWENGRLVLPKFGESGVLPKR